MFKILDKPNWTYLGYGHDTNGDKTTHRYISLLEKGDMWSWGNYRWQDPGPPYFDVGSKLTWAQRKMRRWAEFSQLASLTRTNGGFPNQLTYHGHLAALPTDLRLVTAETGEDWGAAAYQRMKPTKPQFQALNAVYELRDLPGMLRQRFLNQGLKAIPNYWLALQFGWGPLLRDIIFLVTQQRKIEKRLSWLLRHNGKPVRRRVDMYDASSVQDDVYFKGPSAFTGTFVSQFYARTPSNRRITRLDDRVWASAKFRYWLPADPQGVVYKRQVLHNLYGLYPSPSVIWNGLPWTWMADWFGNVGNILENMDAGVAQRLAADYFYIMRERKTTVESFSEGLFVQNSMGKPRIQLSATTYDEMTTRSRIKGDPFGFAFNQGDLNEMQWSILGALGMSRLR